MPTRMAAFEPTPDGYWKQTPEAEKVLGIIRNSGGKDFKIEPAPSVLSDGSGGGMWGSGGGVHYGDGSGTYVDPINGSVSVAAHEAGHASFPTELVADEQRDQAFNKLVRYSEGATPGNALRAAYETISKPMLLEEANAQGVAAAAMNKAGYRMDNNGWQGLPMEKTGLNADIRPELAYPAEYRFGGRFDNGQGAYDNYSKSAERGGYSPVENEVIQSTRASLVPAMERQFEKGYRLIK